MCERPADREAAQGSSGVASEWTARRGQIEVTLLVEGAAVGHNRLVRHVPLRAVEDHAGEPARRFAEGQLVRWRLEASAHERLLRGRSNLWRDDASQALRCVEVAGSELLSGWRLRRRAHCGQD